MEKRKGFSAHPGAGVVTGEGPTLLETWEQDPWGGDDVPDRGAEGFLCQSVAPGSGSVGHPKLSKPRRSPGIPTTAAASPAWLAGGPWAPGLLLLALSRLGHVSQGQPSPGLGDPAPDPAALGRERRRPGPALETLKRLRDQVRGRLCSGHLASGSGLALPLRTSLLGLHWLWQRGLRGNCSGGTL